MTQNTHNVRTRREQLSTYPESVCVGRYSGDTWQLELDGDDLDADRLVEGPVLYVRCDIAHQSQTEAEARGTAEQRRKDAECYDDIHQWRPARGMAWHDCTKKQQDTEASLGYETRTLYTHPANVAALEARIEGMTISLAQSDGIRDGKQKRINELEARIAELKESEQLARADAEASKARVMVLEEEKNYEFNRGYLIACCNIANMHDEPAIACDVLAEGDLTEDDIEVAKLAEYDATALSEIRRARGDQDPIRAAITRVGVV